MKIVRRRTSGLRYACVALALCLFGYGPFSCNEPTVETAREQLRQSNAEGAIEALQGFGEDAPEIHLVRGVAHLNRKETAAEAKASEAAGITDAGFDPNAEPEKPSRLKEAKSALDQAYRGVAELDAIAAREDEGEDKDLERAQRIKSLRARIAFNQGLVAMADARWSDAQVEFLRVLRLMPDDADARWNLEYAWHQENPPCHKRDDDHEPDDSMTDAKPHQERVGAVPVTRKGQARDSRVARPHHRRS